MFFLAMFFDLQFPNDDGTCSTYTSSSDCLKKTNFNKESFCTWEASSTTTDESTSTSADGMCSYNTPHFNFRILLLVAWLQLILSAPIDAFVG